MGFFSNFGKNNDNQSQQPVEDFNVPNNQPNLMSQVLPMEQGYNQPAPQYYNQAQQMAPQSNYAVDQTRAYQKEILREKNEFYQPQFNRNDNQFKENNNFNRQNQQPRPLANQDFYQQQINYYQPQVHEFQHQPMNQFQQQESNYNHGFYSQMNGGYNVQQNQMNYKQPQINYNNPQIFQPQMLNQNQPSFEHSDFYNQNQFGGINNYQANNNTNMQAVPYQNQQMFSNNSAHTYPNNYNYTPAPINNYDDHRYDSYGKKFKRARLIEKPMAKEIRSEKVRSILLMFVGIFGIIITSIMLAVFYRAGDDGKFLGLRQESVMYPLPSIFFLLISIACFGWAVTDLALLHNGVSKFLAQIKNGNETIPYFITRNYKNMIAREVYVNWIAFSTYIIGAISLGILYFLQGQYQSMVDRGEEPSVTFLFWRIATLKNFKTDITINIIVLFSMFGFHIFNIVSTRSRKNNIAGYYNYEPLPATEIRQIKKRANRFCLIILLVVIAIILFAIIIPWLITRKKQGKSLNPWSRN